MGELLANQWAATATPLYTPQVLRYQERDAGTAEEGSDKAVTAEVFQYGNWIRKKVLLVLGLGTLIRRNVVLPVERCLSPK